MGKVAAPRQFSFSLPGLLLALVILCAFAASAAGAAAAGPLPGGRAAVVVAAGRQGVLLVDEITSPVRWRGGGLHLSGGLEIPIRRCLVRAGVRYSEHAVRIESEAPPDTNQIPRNAHPGSALEVLDVWLDLRWPVVRTGGWRLEVGGFGRARVEAQGETSDWYCTHGYGALTWGPLVGLRHRADERTEVGIEASASLLAWVMRSPYPGFAHDWVWQDEVRFHTAAEFVQARLDLTARRALGGRFALDAALGAEYAWSTINRRYASLMGNARLGLVVGL